MTIRKASENTIADGCRGTLMTNSITLDGAGAQTDIIFTINQQMEIIELYGIVTEATNSNTCTNCSFAFSGPGATPDITESAAGVDMSVLAVGSIIARATDSTVAATFGNSRRCVVGETATDRISYNCLLSKNLANSTYVVFNFTGDASTDIDVTFYLRYKTISNASAGGGAGGGGGPP